VWPLGQHVCVLAHKTIEDRIIVAKRFIEENDWKLPMVVDTMDDIFMNTFMAHPERFYVFLPDRTMVFKAQPRNAEYPVSDLHDWIMQHLGKSDGIGEGF
jgi:hypothetical protein